MSARASDWKEKEKKKMKQREREREKKSALAVRLGVVSASGEDKNQ